MSSLRWLVETRRRRICTILVALLLTSPLWGGGSAPRGGGYQVLFTDLAPAELVAAVRAGRPAGYPVGGIDISSHDHRRFPVLWHTEAAVGSRFAYIKATEGTSYVNPHFAADYAAARATGRYVGAYVFARPDLGDPVGQANHFLAHAGFTRDARTLVPFVDLEWPYDGVRAGPCYNLTPDQLRAWVGPFVERIRVVVGRKPMIYTNTYWWNPCTGNDPSYGSYPLDIANYTKGPPKLPAGWNRFTLWQYTPGDPDKRSNHDRDVVNGDLTGLRTLTWPPPPAHR